VETVVELLKATTAPSTAELCRPESARGNASAGRLNFFHREQLPGEGNHFQKLRFT